MFWNTVPKSPLDEETERWQIDCWRWLINGLSASHNLRDADLIVPDFDFFPATDATGHDRAEHLFRCVTRLSGVEDWPFDLVAQAWHPDDDGSGSAGFDYAAGTYQESPAGRMTIGYYPGLVDRPLDLIGTLAHEVSHGVARSINNPPPGGWQMEAFAVDLTTVYLGFGVFGANNAFKTQFGEGFFKGLFGSWSMSSGGYLSQEQWAFALAVFLTLRDESEEAAQEWLSKPLRKMLVQSMDYLDTHPQSLGGLRV